MTSDDHLWLPLEALRARSGSSSTFVQAFDDRETVRHAAHALPPDGKGVLSVTSAILLPLVEDEELIRMNLEEELAEAGFDVVIATNGQDAMSQLDADPTRFCGVLTDIKLGRGSDGWEVAQRARELVPEIPIVYISGDSAHEWRAKGVPGSIMVAKPFVGAQIITAVSTLLNQVAPC